MNDYNNLTWEQRVALSRETYEGETDITNNLEDTPYNGHTPMEWIREFISSFGYYDGSHHKQWVIDQCLRIAFGTPIIVKVAKWGPPVNKINYRISTGEPSQAYIAWSIENELTEEDRGIAP